MRQGCKICSGVCCRSSQTHYNKSTKPDLCREGFVLPWSIPSIFSAHQVFGCRGKPEIFIVGSMIMCPPETKLDWCFQIITSEVHLNLMEEWILSISWVFFVVPDRCDNRSVVVVDKYLINSSKILCGLEILLQGRVFRRCSVDHNYWISLLNLK